MDSTATHINSTVEKSTKFYLYIITKWDVLHVLLIDLSKCEDYNEYVQENTQIVATTLFLTHSPIRRIFVIIRQNRIAHSGEFPLDRRHMTFHFGAMLRTKI